MTADPPTVPPVTWPYFPDTANALLDAAAPNLHLYLVADVGGGRGVVGYVGVDRDRAHDYARNTGGVVARLPVIGDYRPEESR